ncbi:MAG: zf-HC2 domain-containing protein, partial [Victivallales bacterium]
MNCNDYSKLMTDLLAGEISEKDKADLDSHISACESCKKEFEELKDVWALTENALKADFFDGSLGAEQHQKIVNSVKLDIQPVPSKKSTPIKFMWLEIAASIIVCVILAALLLPSLSLPRGNARQFSKINEMKQEKPGSVSGNWHPIVTPKDVFIPQEEKLAEDESTLSRSRGIAKAVSKSEVAVGGELQKGQRKESEELKERAAGKDARYADKNLADDYKYTEVASTAKPAAPPLPAVESVAVSPVTAPAKAAKPETPPVLMPIFARKSVKEEDSKRDASTMDYIKSEKIPVSEIVPRIAVAKEQLAYARVDKVKAANKELSSNVVIGREEDKKVTLPAKSYSLNLKLWDLTDEKTAREFLKRKGANFADTAEISINKDSNTITIKTTKENLEKADELFSELRKAEDSLKEMK